MSPFRLSEEAVQSLLSHLAKGTYAGPSGDTRLIRTDVFIAGSGPIGSTYARTIIDQDPKASVLMADIGAQEDVIIGAHQKNAVKFQKDINSFVYTIKGALQATSIPMPASYIPTLPIVSWAPDDTDSLVINGFNPDQKVSTNLSACAVTRAVGGMATHWTCACPEPHAEERKENPINQREFDALLRRGKALLDVNGDQFDESIRHRVGTREVRSIPLAARRRSENKKFVTWSGSNTVLGEDLSTNKNSRFTLSPETRVTRLVHDPSDPSKIVAAVCRNLKTDRDVLICAKTFVIACGSVCTPQILWNSDIRPDALGKNLTEQSIAFCQIVLKRSIVETISTDPAYKDLIAEHREKHPNDPLPIPFDDPEPQVTIPYSSKYPWHTQIHRDAFSYGDIGPRSNPRVVVDLRFFSKSDIAEKNQVTFSDDHTNIYGMPQPTFCVKRSREDGDRDHRMMQDMTSIANILGRYLPGSGPQFMEAGLALQITGTTRIGNDTKTSVADPESKVHGFKNLRVGGNGCIPDSTACNSTLTSVAIAIKGAESVVAYLK
ncbi:pyranose 2-oxidase [Armillaria luteobubalina]|uniref:Pyranose 2-oxidase n=1 Tax=Armillaria luteobubalina TaxID=153913 RepID=A0AA39PJ93_9AGAR|nr:pyranose 2-oxidase [Armillaria luteobubalina]